MYGGLSYQVLEAVLVNGLGCIRRQASVDILASLVTRYEVRAIDCYTPCILAQTTALNLQTSDQAKYTTVGSTFSLISYPM